MASAARVIPCFTPLMCTTLVVLGSSRHDEHCSVAKSACLSTNSSSMLQASKSEKAERSLLSQRLSRLQRDLLEEEDTGERVDQEHERQRSGRIFCPPGYEEKCKIYIIYNECRCEYKGPANPVPNPGNPSDPGNPSNPGNPNPPPYTPPTRRRRRDGSPTIAPTEGGPGFNFATFPGQDFVTGASSAAGTSSSSTFNATFGGSSAFFDPPDLTPEDASSSSLWKRVAGSSSYFWPTLFSGFSPSPEE